MNRKHIYAAIVRLLFLPALTALLLFSSSCGAERSASDILGDILAETPTAFPAGTVSGTLSNETLATLFGNNAPTEEMTTVADYAIYMAGREGPLEVAVFRCYAASDTRAVSRMCLRRADLLNPHLPATRQAQVTVVGHYVIFAVSDHPDTIITCAKDAIRRGPLF